VGAARLTHQLAHYHVSALAIHGDKTQQERTQSLAAFKRGETTALVATDVAARGLDIAELPAVINFDLPFNAEDYVHRIGRTGRAGASGDAFSLFSENEVKYLADIEALIQRPLERPQSVSAPPGRSGNPALPSVLYPRKTDHGGATMATKTNTKTKTKTNINTSTDTHPVATSPDQAAALPPTKTAAAARQSRKKRPLAALLGGTLPR